MAVYRVLLDVLQSRWKGEKADGMGMKKSARLPGLAWGGSLEKMQGGRSNVAMQLPAVAHESTIACDTHVIAA